MALSQDRPPWSCKLHILLGDRNSEGVEVCESNSECKVKSITWKACTVIQKEKLWCIIAEADV